MVLIVASVSAYAAASDSRIERTNSARDAGALSPWSPHQAAMRAGMSPGAVNDSSAGSKTGTGAVTAAAEASRASRSMLAPSRSQVRTLSDSNHSPDTFFRNRTRPSTPPSLVQFASRAASDRTGASSSTPTSDQVPEEMYAKSGSVAGTATTAEAVSCEPTSVTGACPPTASATDGSSGPSRSPGSRRVGRRPAGRPAAARNAGSHPRVVAFRTPVVDAFVRSAASTPVSQ
ncbi:hypothetical protein QP157_09540 [Sphingomonas sp. LR61]